MDRRHFLKHVAGASAMALPGMQFLSGLRAAEDKLKKENKSLVILWMGGGPSHMDLWDLKPESQNGGEFKPIETAAKGLQVSEILPETAKVMDKLSVIRSLVTNEGSHERGTVLMNIGRQPSPVVQYPAMGSVVSSQLTSKDLPLPGFIGIGGTAQQIGPGFLGMMYAPFTVQNAGSPPANISTPRLADNDKMQEERLRRRQRLFYDTEVAFNQKLYPHLVTTDDRDKKGSEMREAVGSAGQAHQTIYKKGFDLTISPLRTVFELRNEPAKVVESYGGQQNRFGMGCLLARKLVEKGVSCVEIDLGGWDNHGNIFQTLRTGNGPRLDKGIAGLTKDLDERGLLKNTVILWMGEFGRTPRINQNGGRDHWGRCWSVMLGGGAIKGGVAYGSTDKDGTDVKDGKVTTGDLFATVYKALGIDPTTQVRDNLGRPSAIAEGKPVQELVG